MTDETEVAAYRARLAELWDGTSKFRALERVAAISKAVHDLGLGYLTEELRSEACVHAHKLAGSLGMFGFRNASETARNIEVTLLSEEPRPDEASRLLGELRGAIESG